MDELERRKQILLRRIDSLVTEVEAIEAAPKDIYDDLTVIRFKMRFRSERPNLRLVTPTSGWYNFAALKVGDYWYISGGKLPRMNWAELQDWWGRNDVKKVRVATGWQKLSTSPDPPTDQTPTHEDED